MNTNLTRITVALALAFAATSASHACSICGCSLSADWAAQGYATRPGLEAGLRFDYIDQTRLRDGTHLVDPATLDIPGDDEIQQRTLERGTTLDLNYVFAPAWAVTASVPFHDRFHTTIPEDETDISSSHARGLGDLQLLLRYQHPATDRSWSLQAGLKLPSGRFDQTFLDGPAAGETVDRGLQLGTGTTDLLLGAAWFARPTPSLGVFAQALLDQPLAARAGFLPSSSLTLSLGTRWLNPTRVTPQLQFNLKTESREHGSEGDTANSGGVRAYLSPGLTAEITPRVNAFAFVQLPVYQRVDGLQLEPRWLLATGIRLRL